MTLKIADIEEDSPSHRDASATWLLGHTQRITFGTPYRREGHLRVDATLHVPCKHLQVRTGANGHRPRGRCRAHGFEGSLGQAPDGPDGSRKPPRADDGRFRVFYKGRLRLLPLPLKRAARRALPVLGNGANPCAEAPCRTADNTQGAACCRDLTLDVVLPLESDPHLEALLKARKSPYLCKVTRADETIVECEMISACSYLDPADGVSCVLHDRLLPNRQLAKPFICREWPSLDEEEVAHPGCVLAAE